MAEAAVQRSSPPPKRGPVGKLIGAALSFAFWLFVGALGNVLLEWVGMNVFWPEAGARHSVETLEDELRRLDRDFPEGALIRRPARFARDLADTVQRKVYLEWRIADLAKAAASRAGHPGGGGFQDIAGDLSRGFQEYLLAAVAATEVYAIRLAVMVSALPAFALAALVGVVDGLGQRDIRRLSGGRERGQIYHLARGVVFPAFALPWILYLSWPDTVAHPNRFILPFALLFGFALWVTASSFKKYL
jgi:integrating conjugative element membrane protein (TIGR03747 family)